MSSFSAKISTGFMIALNFKKLVEKSFQHPPRTKKPLVYNNLRDRYVVNEFQIMDKSVITLFPKTNISNIHILFFHGGAYLLEGSSMHWKIVEKVATKANCKVSYIDYPLAPENNYRTTFEMVQQSYDKLINKYPNDRFMLMGDSAGGGLALAFAQELANENALVQPEKNILFSPWLDLSMQNPAIKHQEQLDKILPLVGLIEAGKKYAGGDDVNNYLLSPINGDFSNLGDTLIFYGTHELFYPDCKLLKGRMENFGNFSFREFQGMQHDWVIFPIPEADEALEVAVEFVKNKIKIN